MANECEYCVDGLQADGETPCTECSRSGTLTDEGTTRPAAPVEGLERYAPRPCDEMQEHLGMDRHKYGEYVLFSQAESIITAERAEKEKAQASRLHWIRKHKKLEADNAALTARVKELEEENKSLTEEWYRGLRVQQKISDRAEALETQLAAARKALEFYGDVHKYPAPLTGGMGALWSDCGAIARAALEDLP